MIRKKDCCDCGDWKSMLRQLWEKYQNVVKSIKADGRSYYPDGEGEVSLPGMLSDLELVDMKTYWNAVVDTNISTISLTDKTTYWTLEVE